MVATKFGEQPTLRGAQKSIVESFGIYGLYGYKDVSLSSDHAATILIARNGSGKTTLLGALNAFLRGQFSRLREIQFDSIRCKIRDLSRELILYSQDVSAFLEVPSDGDLIKLARKIEVDPTQLFIFITEDFDDLLNNPDQLSDNKVYGAISRNTGYSTSEAIKQCEALKRSLVERVPEINEIITRLSLVLEDTEIVYLPTYRRVELPLIDSQNDRPTFVKRKKARLRVTGHGLFTSEMQFGLADISDRLAELNRNMLVESNQGYRQISANIINEMLDGSFENYDYFSANIPTKDELELFFSRLKEVKSGLHYGPYSDVIIPNISKIYSDGEKSSSSGMFLMYFLAKLNTVISVTKGVEGTVEEFIYICNKYLCGHENRDEAITNENRLQIPGLDLKALHLNRKNLKVSVLNLQSGKRISLDALSSGEKQMVSLFARLYLYPKKKLVLIDEPELSLSLDWQREILVDILNAPLCSQVIAITHSPFVFDNELEPFARSLHLVVRSQGDDFESDFDLEGDLGE